MRILTVLTGFLAFGTVSVVASDTATIRAADYGEKWPFTVPEGLIECTPLGEKLHILTFTADGKTYGLNGTARNIAKEKGYAEINSIWKDDPVTGAKINIGPIIEKGLSLCE